MRAQISLVNAKRTDQETTRPSRQKKRGNLGTHMHTNPYVTHVKILKTEDMRCGCLRKRSLREGAKGIIGISSSERQLTEELSIFNNYEKG